MIETEIITFNVLHSGEYVDQTFPSAYGHVYSPTNGIPRFLELYDKEHKKVSIMIRDWERNLHRVFIDKWSRFLLWTLGTTGLSWSYTLASPPF